MIWTVVFEATVLSRLRSSVVSGSDAQVISTTVLPFEAQRLIRALGGFVGGDVLEVSPPFDPSGLTALHAPSLVGKAFGNLDEPV